MPEDDLLHRASSDDNRKPKHHRNATKKSTKQKVERFIRRRVQPECDVVREFCREWINEKTEEIVKAYDNLPELEFLPDRDAEGWEPLFTILSVAAPNRIPELRLCAESLTGQKIADAEDDSLPLRLLADVRAVWPRNMGTGLKESKAGTAILIFRLRAIEESPWADESDLNPRKLARLVRPFGIESRQIRVEDKTVKGYLLSELQLAFERYLTPETKHPKQPA